MFELPNLDNQEKQIELGNACVYCLLYLKLYVVRLYNMRIETGIENLK